MEPTLESLVAQFQAGDQDAARELSDRFAAEMLALVRRRLIDNRVRGALDSEGIVQDGFRSFFSAIGKPDFDPHWGSLGGLLATIVSRKALVQLRRKFPTSVDPDDLGTASSLVGPILKLTEVEIEASRQEVVSQLLDELTNRERPILALHLDRGNDLSISEIAKLCKRSETSVSDTIDRFYAMLRQLSGIGAR